MGIGLEWHCDHCATLRVGEFYESFGHPYEFACTLVVKGGTATLHGAISFLVVPLLKFRSALRQLFLSIGVQEIKWARLKAGKLRWKHFPLKRF